MTQDNARKKVWFNLLTGCFLIAAMAGCAESRGHHKNREHLAGGGPHAVLSAEPAFQFVVIGDTRTGNDIFEKNIEEINLLDPDLVIDIGDLIQGYVRGDDPAERTTRIETMWNDFDQRINKSAVPFIMVMGNHDIWDPLSRKIYEQRYGRTYFSFDHKGAHFIVLDSETFGLGKDGKPINRINDNQLAWLEHDLASHKKAKATFVFLHKPFWQNAHVAGGAGEHWQDEVHPLLAEYHVSAVFAGHVHKYTKFPSLDGVAYYITGGGGAEIGEQPAEGDFHHYALVTVRGHASSVAIIESGSIKPDTIVTSDIAVAMSMLKNAAISTIDPADPKRLEISLKNSLNRPVSLTAKSLEGTSSWKITPAVQTVTINPSDTAKIEFDVKFDDPGQIYPGPQFSLELNNTGEEALTVIRAVPITPIRSAPCARIASPPTLDGRLDDQVWANLKSLADFLTPDSQRKAQYLTDARLAYDAENLYLAFRCYEPNLPGLVTKVSRKDGPVWDDDEVEIFVDPKLDRKSYYQFAVNANAFVYDCHIIDGNWNGDLTVKAGHETNAWTLEAAIPWGTLGLDNPGPGTKIGFDVVRSRAQKPQERSLWAPTFGGNHVPSQFGTITLE